MGFVFVLMAACFSLNSWAQVELPADVPRVRWEPNPLFSEKGFRLGYIPRASYGTYLRNLEGYLLMGIGSNPTLIYDSECQKSYTARVSRSRDSKVIATLNQEMNENCLIDRNPWYFSMLGWDVYMRAKQSERLPVVVYYETAVNTPVAVVQNRSLRPVVNESLNIVYNIFTVDPNMAIPPPFRLPGGGVLEAGSKRGGSIEGRVVKASLDHGLRKAYEITVQLSDIGNNFMRLSISESEMFDHIVYSMMTGHLVRLSYVRLFGAVNWMSSVFSAYSTNYRVTEVEILATGTDIPPIAE